MGSFSSPGGFGTATGGPAEGPYPYSLTIEETFNAGSDGVAGFSVNGNITASPVPVPPSLAMLGSGLLALILVRRGRWGPLSADR